MRSYLSPDCVRNGSVRFFDLQRQILLIIVICKRNEVIVGGIQDIVFSWFKKGHGGLL